MSLKERWVRLIRGSEALLLLPPSLPLVPPLPSVEVTDGGGGVKGGKVGGSRANALRPV